MWLKLDFQFGKIQCINFTEVSIARRASIRRNAREKTTPHAPGEPPDGCLGDPVPFLLECESASELKTCDLWSRLRTRLQRMSHNVKLETGLGTSLARGAPRFCETAGDLGQHVQDWFSHCRLGRWMKSHVDGSPDIILCGWLSSKHQLTN